MVDKEIEEKESEEVKEKEIEDETIVEEKAEEVQTVEKETEEIQEVELEDDPWSEENWKKSFPELYEETEKAVGLTKEDVIRIVRDQIKLWLRGVGSGKYPLPKGMKPTEYPYPKKKDIEGLEDEFEEIRKSIEAMKSDSEKFETLEKSLDDIKKEVQIIKDQPAEIIEKSIEDKSKIYKPSIEIEDGHIRRKEK